MHIYDFKHTKASKTCTLSKKVGQKHVPFIKKSVGAVDFQGGSKTCTLRQKVRQKHVPLCKKSAPVRLRCGIEPPSGTPPTGKVKRCFCEITRVFSCILRHVGSDPQAERGRGEVNLSPIQVLTLRPRVGGFYVSGRLREARFVVFYVSGRSKKHYFTYFTLFFRFGRAFESNPDPWFFLGPGALLST